MRIEHDYSQKTIPPRGAWRCNFDKNWFPQFQTKYSSLVVQVACAWQGDDDAPPSPPIQVLEVRKNFLKGDAPLSLTHLIPIPNNSKHLILY